jgi:hypothetical protein
MLGVGCFFTLWVMPAMVQWDQRLSLVAT